MLMTSAKEFHQGDRARTYGESSPGAVDTGTLLRMADDHGCGAGSLDGGPE